MFEIRFGSIELGCAISSFLESCLVSLVGAENINVEFD